MGRSFKYQSLNQKDHFWSKVNKSVDAECWEWGGGKVKGKYCIYGMHVFNGKNRLAHRVAWELTNGGIPKGEGYHGTCVLHKCDNPLCCNPKHLFLGSNKDNIKDRDNKGRQVTQRGADHKLAVLTEDAVLDIRHTHKTYWGSGRDLAAKYGVSATKIAQVYYGQSWRHI